MSFYLWAWALWPCLFFTPSRNILWTYVLPALPALAILGAAWLAEDPRRARTHRFVALGLALTAILFVGATGHRMIESRVKSAKAVIAVFEARRTGIDELVFVGANQFSAAFYGRGRYRVLPDFDALQAMLRTEEAESPEGGQLYVAIRRWVGEQPPPAIAIQLRHEGSYQGYELLRVVK
jgi:hypothetical protein